MNQNRRVTDGKTEFDSGLDLGTNLALIDRAGEQSRLRERLNTLMPRFIVALVLVGIGCLVMARMLVVQSALEESRLKFDAQSSALAITQRASSRELGRDRLMMRFICGELAYQDAWRNALHKTENRYRSATNDPYFLGRDRAFDAMEQHAIIRQRACSMLVGTQLVE